MLRGNTVDNLMSLGQVVSLYLIGMDEKYNSLLSFLDLGKHQNYGEFRSERLSFGSDIEARWTWNKTKLDEDVKLEQSLVARDHYSGQQETFPR